MNRRHSQSICLAALQDANEDPTGGRINVWEGPQMSTYSRQMAKWQSSGFGPLVSMTAVTPPNCRLQDCSCQRHLQAWKMRLLQCG